MFVLAAAAGREGGISGRRSRPGCRRAAVPSWWQAAATVPLRSPARHTSLWPLGAVLLIRGFAIGTVLVPPLSIAYQDIPSDGIPHATMNTRITQASRHLLRHRDRRRRPPVPARHSATSAFQGAFWWATGITTAALIPALTLPTRAREGD